MNRAASCLVFLFSILVLAVQPLPGQSLKKDGLKPDQIVPYKQAEDIEGKMQDLTLRVFYPELRKESNPAVLIFHGGVFGNAAADRMYPLASRWKHRGLIAIVVEFRTLDRFKMPRTEGIDDPFEALEYVHKNARALNVNPNRIVVCGGSGGGYVSAALATLERKKPGLPAATVVFNGMMDLTVGGANPEVGLIYSSEDPKRCAAISPLLQVDPLDSPIIQFHGTADKSTVWSEADHFNNELIKHGVHCEFHSYGGKGHGFWKGSFKPGRNDDVIFNEVMGISMRFLRELDIVD